MNLRDRMNSDSQNSKLIETKNEPMQNLNNTTKNLNQQPQDSILQKQSETIQKQSSEIQHLTNTIQELQSQMDKVIPELEHLRKQGRPSDIEMIQNLSSENSILSKKLQEKSETIVSLNDKIGMLSSADLVLKENERLEQNNRDLQKKEQSVREEATATISAVKREYRTKQAELQTSIDNANAREREAQKQIAEESSRINSLAEFKVANTKADLQRKYKSASDKQQRAFDEKQRKLDDEYTNKTNTLYALTYGGTFYGFFTTLLTAINSPRFSADIVSALTFIVNFVYGVWENAVVLGSAGWSLNAVIPYPVVNVIVPGLLAVLGFIAVFGFVFGLLSFGIYQIAKFYTEFFADGLSILVALVSLALLVWFADILSFITWNLIIIFILIHVVYIFLRMVMTSANRY